MLKSSCIRSMTCYLRIELLCLGDPRLQRKQRFSVTDMVDGICTSETGIIFDRGTNGHTERRQENNTSPATMVRRVMNIAYQGRILLGFQNLCIIS